MRGIEDDLLIATGAGSASAFRELFRRMRGRLVGLATGIVGDHHLAEDVAQETLAEVWSTASRFRPELGSAVGWMLRLARFRAIDRVRAEQTDRERLTAAGSAALTDEGSPAGERLEVAQSVAPLMRALDRLAPPQREAIVMTHLDGLTFVEAARRLGVPVGTVKSRAHDGMLRLRDALSPEGDVHAPPPVRRPSIRPVDRRIAA